MVYMVCLRITFLQGDANLVVVQMIVISFHLFMLIPHIIYFY